jgi:hypothetical protein
MSCDSILRKFSQCYEKDTDVLIELDRLLIDKQINSTMKIKIFSIKINQVNSENSFATGKPFDLKEKNEEFLEKRNENIRRILN